MLEDYIEEIDFSVKLCKPHSPIPWRKILKRVKNKEKTYDEKDYAFGIYQILPCPPTKEDMMRLSDLSEFLRK